MASIIHNCNGVEISAQSDNPAFLLTNDSGDYICFGNPNNSNYDGYYVKRAGEYWKILYNVAAEEETTEMGCDGYHVVRKTGSSVQSSFILDDGVIVGISGQALVTLDCKRLYDESDSGRIYDITVNRSNAPNDVPRNSPARISTIDVGYTKYLNDGSKSYSIFACIVTTLDIENVSGWREIHYAYDSRRGTSNTPWVFDAIRVSGAGDLCISVGDSAEDAKRRAVDIMMKKESLVNARKRIISAETPSLSPHALIAWRSLRSLTTKEGIMAGLPWFFQQWSRDELISCGGYIAVREYGRVISIIDRWCAAVRPDGTLPAIYPDKGLTSADAPGWLGKRIRDLLVKLSSESLLHQLPKEMMLKWMDSTGILFDSYSSRIQSGLVRSEFNQTWMDTSYNDDGRAGFRIEIQALYLALFDAHAHLCVLTKTPVQENRKRSAQDVIEAVRSKLVVRSDGIQLLDGLHSDGEQDLTVRPNIFIAWYIAPRLFEQAEWREFFGKTLPRLWLEWGGLSSIATDDRNFHANYTGENVVSYHRGDSWYFVNNIAAMALLDVDPSSKAYAQRMIAASVHDMLSLGMVGHCSEISSARSQEACGCHAQAWSASTLLELLLRL